jgi:ketopantoate reductase
MKLPRAFVIGMGEVGRRLAGALERAGVEVVPVTRTAGWDRALSAAEGARVVCVGEAELAAVVERLRNVPPDRLVFVQNGWIRRELEGVAAHSRGLVWFTSKGDFFRVLRPSPFAGPLAGELAEALSSGSIAAEALGAAPFRAAEAEKMGFNCVVGLPLAVHRVTLAEYLSRHTAEAHAAFSEAVTVTARALGVDVEQRWWSDFLIVVEPLGWVRSSAPKALAWRNGAVVALARELGIAAPANQQLLSRVAAG